MFQRVVKAGVVGLVALFLGRGVAEADISPSDPPEGRRVAGQLELDWGVFAERVSRLHVVAAGETLGTIAAKHLGNPARARDLLAWNPTLGSDPDHVQVGAEVWMPSVRSLAPAAVAPTRSESPVLADRTALADWYEAFWLERSGSTEYAASARAAAGALPESQRYGGRLALIPHTSAVSVLERLPQGRVPVIGGFRDPNRTEAFPKPLYVATLVPDTLVHKDDPAVRVVLRARLTGVKDDGTLVATTERVRYDAAGKALTKPYPVRQPSFHFEEPPEPVAGVLPPPPANPRWPSQTGLWVALGGAALVSLLWLLRRRPRATPA